MAACPFVDLLARAQPVIRIKGEVAGIGPGQLEQQHSMAGGYCRCCLPGFFGNIKRKLDLLWDCQGLSLQKGDSSCVETGHILSQEKSLGFLPVPERSLFNDNSYSDVSLFHSLGMIVLSMMIACCNFFL